MDSYLQFIIWILASSPIAASLSTEAHVQIFESRGISNLATAEIYLQIGYQNFTHSWTRVWYCNNQYSLSVGLLSNKCSANAPRFDRIVQRLSTVNKAIFFQFDIEACKRIDSVISDITRNAYKSLWLGMRMVRGPYSKESTVTDKTCISSKLINGKQVSIIMFQEEPIPRGGTNEGYTDAQLGELRRLMQNSVASYIALDALYLSKTSKELMQKHMQGVGVIIYQLERQDLPDLSLLRNTYATLKTIVKKGMLELMLDRRVIDRMMSYIPKVDWTQIPSKWQNSFPNTEVFYEYLAEGQPLIQMTVITRDGIHFLNDKTRSAILSVTLDRALQLVSRSRAMLFYFPLMDHRRTYLGEFALGTLYPCVLLRLARGPNYDGGLDDFKLFEPQQKVTYFVGFAEAKGTRWKYSEDDVNELINVLGKMGNRHLGVYLSAEFLIREKGIWQFQRLLYMPTFKWLYVHSGNINSNEWNPTEAQVKNLKWNIRAFQRETYIHTDWKLRTKIYKWEHIPDPELPTTTLPPVTGSSSYTVLPSSTGSSTSTEKTTTSTTTEIPPSIDIVTLTSEATSKLTTFGTNYTAVTFPTIEAPSGTTTKISHPLLGALFYLLWGNWGY